MIKILWADDEIDLLKPHIIYLQEKGYELFPVKSGDEALDLLLDNPASFKSFESRHQPHLEEISKHPKTSKVRCAKYIVDSIYNQIRK